MSEPVRSMCAANVGWLPTILFPKMNKIQRMINSNPRK